MYSLSMVFKRISRRKLGNIITSVQIFIGTALVVFSFNVLLYADHWSDKLLESSRDRIYSISVRNMPKNPATHIVSKEQIRRLNDVPGLLVSVSIKYSIVTFAGRSHLENGEDITDEYVITFSGNTDEILAEKEFAEVLPTLSAENTINFGDVDLARVHGYGVFDDGAEHLHSCTLPLDLYWEIAKPSAFSGFELDAFCGSPDDAEKILLLLDILADSEEYEFNAGNDFYDFMEKASYAVSSSSKVMLFSAVVLTVVFVTTACIFMLLAEERGFEIAVCRTVGARAGSVFAEFALELALISLVPALLSIPVVGCFFNSGVEFSGLVISEFYFGAAALGVLCIVPADALCLVAAACGLRRLKPYELLISEG